MKARRGRRLARAAALCCAVAVSVAMVTGVAFAGNSAATAVLTGGSLSISEGLAGGSFSGTLNGAAQELSGTGFNGFQITDARATGVGWDVTVQATQFVNTTSPGHNIALNSFTMPLLTVLGQAGSSDEPGTLHAAAAIDTGAAGVQMAACDVAGQGMGVYDFTAVGSDWKLDIASDEYAGSYESTVTLTLATLTLM